MQRLTLSGGIPDQLRGSIVALGNFDGFHLGHQAAVGRACLSALFHERRPAIVATFDPHRSTLFKPDLPPFRLTTLDQRQAMFAHAGADAMLVFEFDARARRERCRGIRSQDPRQRIGAAGVVPATISASARAARRLAVLKRVGAEHGIAAEAVAQVLMDGDRFRRAASATR